MVRRGWPVSMCLLVAAVLLSATAACFAPLYLAPPMRESKSKATDHDTPAHAPRFEDASLWPGLAGKEAYVKQAWPKARLLTWAGGDGNFADPSKWLENGKPA